MLILFIVFFFIRCDPPTPYWRDFTSSIILRVDKFGPNWKSAADFYYKGSESKMRIDYWNFCEPHFENITDHRYSCSFVFVDSNSYYVADDVCCIFQSMGPLKPDFVKDAKYTETKIFQNIVVTKWDFQSTPGAYYLAEYSTGKPIQFRGSNPYLGLAATDYIYYDETSDIPDDLFVVPEKCKTPCQFNL